MALTNPGQSFCCAATSSSQRLSAVRYGLSSALGGVLRLCWLKNFAPCKPPSIHAAAAHAPSAIRDVVTWLPLPVFSRWYKPVTMAEYRVLAVAWSPIPGIGSVGG